MGDPPSSTVVHDAIQEKKAVLDAAGWRAAERVAAAQEHAQKAADSVVAEACSKADQRTAAADKMESQASAGLSAAQAESSKINEELLRAKQDVGELQAECKKARGFAAGKKKKKLRESIAAMEEQIDARGRELVKNEEVVLAKQAAAVEAKTTKAKAHEAAAKEIAAARAAADRFVTETTAAAVEEARVLRKVAASQADRIVELKPGDAIRVVRKKDEYFGKTGTVTKVDEYGPIVDLGISGGVRAKAMTFGSVQPITLSTSDAASSVDNDAACAPRSALAGCAKCALQIDDGDTVKVICCDDPHYGKTGTVSDVKDGVVEVELDKEVVWLPASSLCRITTVPAVWTGKVAAPAELVPGGSVDIVSVQRQQVNQRKAEKPQTLQRGDWVEVINPDNGRVQDGLSVLGKVTKTIPRSKTAPEGVMVKFEDGKVELLKRRSVKPSAVRGSSLIKQKAAAAAAPAAAATEGSSAATMDDSGAARPRGLGLPVLSEAPEAVTKDCRGKIEEALQRLNCSKDVKQRLSSAVDDIPVPADASTSRAFDMAEEALPTATKGCKDKASTSRSVVVVGGASKTSEDKLSVLLSGAGEQLDAVQDSMQCLADQAVGEARKGIEPPCGWPCVPFL